MRAVTIGLIVLVFSLLLLTPSTGEVPNSIASGIQSVDKQKEWSLSSSPVIVTQNSDFVSQGFPGSGTPGDPYRIENLIIDGAGGSCITINDTSANFVINNCSLYNGYFSLTINRVANGIISYCNFTGNFLAIYMESCSSMNIHHNNLSGNTRGVWCEDVSDIFIDYNNVTNVPGSYGIAFKNCLPGVSKRVRYNNISGCGDGILIDSSYFCFIFGNTIADNFRGIFSHSGAECTIRGNYIGHNSWDNAVDDGHDNSWDDGDDLKGNFWDDYISGTYAIPGTAGAVDNYPRAWPLDAPEIDSPVDISYTRGDTGNTITWEASDLHPFNYTIIRNEAVTESDSWDGSSISIIVDDLTPGNYTYTLYVEDLGGNTAHDSVIVTVLRDTTDPEITHVSDINFVEGTVGEEITWFLADTNPSNYTIYRNGTNYRFNTWVSNSFVYENLDGLEPGFYNFTILIEDLDGNTASDIVFVEIIYDSFPPVFQNCSRPVASFYFGEDEEGPIEWLFSDDNPHNFIIYLDEVIMKSGFWSGEEITYLISEFPPGQYNVTLIVYDKNGNLASSVVQVTVIEHPPLFIINIAIFGISGLGIVGAVVGIVKWSRNRR